MSLTEIEVGPPRAPVTRPDPSDMARVEAIWSAWPARAFLTSRRRR